MKNQRIEWTNKEEKIIYFYRRNYYGFRGKDLEPSEINALILGGSVIEERYKPEKYTITEFLNESIKKDYNFYLTNGGVAAQSTKGMVLSFKNWLFKMKDFSPRFILFYVGINDVNTDEKDNLDNIKPDGHLINPDKREVIKDNIKSRSILYDTVRIFKFKYLPRDGFIKYDGQVSSDYKKKFNFLSYNFAKENYNINNLKNKYDKKIKNYLYRIDLLYEMSKNLNSQPIFITNIEATGHIEELFIMNFQLMEHCKIKNYNCIDMAKKVDGNVDYWRDGTHTTKKGSKKFSDLIYFELKEIFKIYN
jgi:hypothetical protein